MTRTTPLIEHGIVSNDRLREHIVQAMENEVALTASSSRSHAWLDTKALTFRVAEIITGSRVVVWPGDGDALERRITSLLGRLLQDGTVVRRRLSVEFAYAVNGMHIANGDPRKVVWTLKLHAIATDLAHVSRVHRERARGEKAAMVVDALHGLGRSSAQVFVLGHGDLRDQGLVLMSVEDAQALVKMVTE